MAQETVPVLHAMRCRANGRTMSWDGFLPQVEVPNRGRKSSFFHLHLIWFIMLSPLTIKVKMSYAIAKDNKL